MSDTKCQFQGTETPPHSIVYVKLKEAKKNMEITIM